MTHNDVKVPQPKRDWHFEFELGLETDASTRVRARARNRRQHSKKDSLNADFMTTQSRMATTLYATDEAKRIRRVLSARADSWAILLVLSILTFVCSCFAGVLTIAIGALGLYLIARSEGRILTVGPPYPTAGA